jgi:hypothetical protein
MAEEAGMTPRERAEAISKALGGMRPNGLDAIEASIIADRRELLAPDGATMEAMAQAIAEFDYEGDIWERLQENEETRLALPQWRREEEPTGTKHEYREQARAALDALRRIRGVE